MIFRHFILLLAITSPLLAQSVGWGGPSTVTGTMTYWMTAYAQANLTVLKNGQYFASGFGSAGSSTSDTAGQTVNFSASGFSSNNQIYYSGSKSVSIVSGSAPSVSLSVPSSVMVGASFSVTISVSDSDGDLDSYGLRWQGNGLVGWWGPGGGTSGTQTMTFTAPSSPGTMNFRGEVWDRNGHGVAGDWNGIPVVKAGQSSVGISPSSTWCYIGESVGFSASGGNGSGSYIWGDSASGSGSSKYVTFNNEGSHSVSVYRQGDASYEDSNTATASIQVYKRDQPSVSSSNATITMGSSFYPNFNGGAGGGSWEWHVSGYTSWMTGSWTPPGAGSYTFYVYKGEDWEYYGSNTAGGYTLTVNKGNQNSVTIAPGSQSVSVGTTITFSAGGGSGSGAYTWGGDASGTGSSKSVTFNTTGTRTVTVYRAGDNNYHASNTATVTITVGKLNQSPNVTISPSSQTVSVGQSISFTAAGGSGSGAYTWGGDASGTGSSKSVTFNTAGTRTVTVYRAGDSTYNNSNSATATITVNNLPPQPTVTISPTTHDIGMGQAYTFTASGGAGSGDFVWSGEASGTGASKSVTFNTAGNRTVTVHREGGSSYQQSNSATATVTVHPPPGISSQPQSQTVVTGDTAIFSVTATGTSLGFQWRRNGTNIPGETSSTLVLENVLPEDAATYDVFVYNNYGSVTSIPANLITKEPPVVLAAHTPEIISSTQVKLSGSAMDPDGNLKELKFWVSFPAQYNGYWLVGTASVSGSTGTAEITFNPSTVGPVAWGLESPPYPAGVYHVWVRAIDHDNNVDANGGEFTTFTLGSPSGASIDISPYEVSHGHVVTVTYTSAPTGSWVGLFRPNAANSEALLSQNVPAGNSSTTFSISSAFSLGQVYHARLFGSAGTSNRIATSNGIVMVNRWGLSVVDGTGGESYRPAGTVLDIVANPPPPGEGFVGWTIVSGPGTLGNASQSATTFTMGDGNAIVRANFTGIPQITSVLSASGDLEFPFSYILTASNSPTNFTAINLPPGLNFQVLSNPTRGVISGTPTVYGSFNIPVSASNAAGAGYGLLTLEISNSGGPPDIMQPPQPRAVIAGSTATFTVAATSEIAMTFQWQRKLAGTPTFANIASGGTYAGGSGPIAVTLNVSSTTLAMSGDEYRCVVSNSAGPTTTAAAMLTVGVADTTGQNQLNIHLPTTP